MKTQISWSQYNAYKKELMNVNDFWVLPIIKSSQDLVLSMITPGTGVLEIGAGEGHFKQLAKQKGANVKTMDVDPNTQQDFYNIDDVNGEYDIVAMFSTIEHIPLDDFVDRYLPQIYRVLKPGGKLVINFPSPFHVLFIRTDITHHQGYAPRDLYALLRLAGLKEGRVYRVTPMGGLKRAFFTWMSKYILRPYALDFTAEMLIVMTK